MEAYASKGLGMPITLRNKVVEERIRAIGKQTGEGPSAVIARLSSQEEERLKTEKEAQKEKRDAAIKRLRAMLPKLTDEDRRAIDQAMDDIYDENGLPK
jgi:Rv0623-like transcription factor